MIHNGVRGGVESVDTFELQLIRDEGLASTDGSTVVSVSLAQMTDQHRVMVRWSFLHRGARWVQAVSTA